MGRPEEGQLNVAAQSASWGGESSASREEWGYAYLAQARSDLAAAVKVGVDEPSVLAMLLQMTFEKAAKGILLIGRRIDVDRAASTHVAASLLVAHLKREPDRLRLLGAGAAAAYRTVLPFVVELERLNPATVRALGHRSDQLEYPWSDGQTGSICWPARDLQVAVRLGDPRSTEASRLLRFAHALLAHATELVS